MEKEKLEHVAEGADRLVTLDLRARGVIYKLYEAARELTGTPLTLTAAQKIMEVVKSGDTVLITTGFRVLPQRVQETDGPLGAASLARALHVTFNARPILLIEEQSKDILTAALNGIGMSTTGAERSVSVLGFPSELKEAILEAKRVLDEYEPPLVLAIEKAGRNSKGEYHTMRGLNISPFHAKVEPLFEEACRRGVLTIGIGDGGNEVGMGNIKEAVEAHVPYGRLCQCPCKGGIAADSAVDVLVASAISNWGAYGIEACLSYLTEKPEVLHTLQQEESMLKAAVEAGALDGVTGRAEPSVDSAPLHLHSSLISMLQALTRK
ncbi:MAG: hypothetical protein AOA65_1114 [Candidatus Bathyarchaeota archaeon BA1]|nr:MAG: hypothetical protein AOA65_1114 [Candidatus Bathyarchaeota archaeon BA1]